MKAPAAPDVLALVAGIDPERAHLTPVGVQGAGDHPDGRGLAGPVRAQQDGDLAFRHRQVQIRQGIDLAEATAEPACVYDWSAHTRPSAGPTSAVSIRVSVRRRT